MTRALGALIPLVVIVASLPAQREVRLYTNPRVPPREVLDRLNLSVAWHVKLPTMGLRDGLFTLQLFPAKNQMHLVVQSIQGAVFLFDANTGDLLWRTAVGIPGWNGQPAGYNENNIFVTRRDVLYVLNRVTGAQRLFTVDPSTKLPSYGFQLPAAPSAAPVADEDALVFCMGHRIEAYEPRDWNAAEAALKSPPGKEASDDERAAVLEKTSALAPLRRWTYADPGLSFEQPVLLTADQVTAATRGAVLSLNKFERSQQPYEFQTSGPISVPMGQHGVMAYIGSEDYTLYALNLGNQRLAWRFLSGAPIRVKPEVTDRDVYVSSHKVGLYRVERDTGRPAWLNKQAERFLSTNQKYVYALDATGLLLILDYARGTTMAQYDMRDWILTAPNELSDRFYLASHDGQVLCLRNRAELAPVKNKTIEIKKKEEKKDEKKDEPKDMEKEKDKDAAKDAAMARTTVVPSVVASSAPRWQAGPPRRPILERRWRLRP